MQLYWVSPSPVRFAFLSYLLVALFLAPFTLGGGPSHTHTAHMHFTSISRNVVSLLLGLAKIKKEGCAHLRDARRGLRLSCCRLGAAVGRSGIRISQGHDTGLLGGVQICCPSKKAHHPQAGELLDDESVGMEGKTRRSGCWAIGLNNPNDDPTHTTDRTPTATHVSARRRARCARFRSS